MTLLLLLSANIAQADPVFLGVQSSNIFPVGISAQFEHFKNDKPFLNYEIILEASGNWQALGFDASIKPFSNPLALGVKIRWVQLHPPWSRAYNFAFDNAISPGILVFGDWFLLEQDQLKLKTGLGFFDTFGTTKMPVIFEVFAGVAWQI